MKQSDPVPPQQKAAAYRQEKVNQEPVVQQQANHTGIPDPLKNGIENLSGYSLNDVKVHYNSSQPAALQAHAYAQGSDIHIAPGQEKHLPHEAWHVVQQKQGRVKPTAQLKGKTPLNDDAGLEKEADVMGAKALSRTCLPVSGGLTQAISTHLQTIQRAYDPGQEEVGEKFWIRKTRSSPWIRATLEEVIKDVGCVFKIDGEEDTIEVNDIQRISNSESDPNIKKGRGTKKNDEWLFHNENTEKQCQFPGCEDIKFENYDQLHEHLRNLHTFPKQKYFPYALFGEQGAKSHVLNKKQPVSEEKEVGKKRDWQESVSMSYHSKKTGNNMHSEWNTSGFLPFKKHKKNTEDEDQGEEEMKKEIDTTQITSDFSHFMNDEEPQSFFYTGEPHCALCTHSFATSGMPTTYPSLAQPSQSQGYYIPKHAPKLKDIQKLFSSEGPTYDKPGSIGYDRGNFPKMSTREAYNKNIPVDKEQKSPTLKDNRASIQSMAANKFMYERYFEALENKGGDISREDMKKQALKTPVPENSHTFDLYIPSPKRGGEDEEYNKLRDRMIQGKKMKEISDMFWRLQDENTKIDVQKEDKDSLNPLAANNSLITAMNGGKNASEEDVTMIRYLLNEEMKIPYGAMLQAAPEVIHTIAMILDIDSVTVHITVDDNKQVFWITGLNVIEVEGDEIDNYEQASEIWIKQNGKDYFEYSKTVEKASSHSEDESNESSDN